MEPVIRHASQNDLDALLSLYLFLHETQVPAKTPELLALWGQILADPGYHILIAEAAGKPISSVTLVVVKNLTRGPRPYALIENVVTDPAFRGRGYATALLNEAVETARRAGCYKVMLMTGSKEKATLRFYERAGFDAGEKTAFVRRL